MGATTLVRKTELRGLSEQHHYGLVESRELRLAAEGTPEAIERARSAFLSTWTEQIEPHFRSEETALLPEYGEGGGDWELIRRTLEEHTRIRGLVRRLEQGGEPTDPALLTDLATLLHDHIRFEERTLFPSAESVLGPEAWHRMHRELPQQPLSGSCSLKSTE